MSEMPPSDPNAKSAVPINEATESELLAHLRDSLVSDLITRYNCAVADSKELIGNPIITLEDKDEGGRVMARRQVKLDPDQFAIKMALIWRPMADRLEGLQILMEHLMFRVGRLRSKGILPGDPREHKVLDLGAEE